MTTTPEVFVVGEVALLEEEVVILFLVVLLLEVEVILVEG